MASIGLPLFDTAPQDRWPLRSAPSESLILSQMQQVHDIITSLKWTLYVKFCSRFSGICQRKNFSVCFLSRVVVSCLVFSEVVLWRDHQ